MLKKVPVAVCPIDLVRTFAEKNPARLHPQLARYLGLPFIYFFNSGSAALLTALEAMREPDERNEVILPAHTNFRIAQAIRQAGLTPRPCDISLSDFNIDLSSARAMVNNRTLALIVVHTFGIPMRGLSEFKKAFPAVYLIEDCAQALGSRIDGAPVGKEGDAAVFSFNRGKNITSYSGGFVATAQKSLAGKILQTTSRLPNQSIKERLANRIKLALMSIAVNPYVYGAADMLLRHLKEAAPGPTIEAKKFSSFQARTVSVAMDDIDTLSLKRYQHGTQLIGALKGIDAIKLPIIASGSRPAFNRLPLLCRDRELLRRRLAAAGIESAPLCAGPLHHALDLGYAKTDLPAAVFFADNLLTIPTHPLLGENDIIRMIRVIKKHAATLT